MEVAMKRMILAVVLLAGGVLGAQADTDVWVSSLKQPRHDPNAAANIDADYCSRTVGPDLNGQPTPAKFKRCMASRGWRFGHTTRERAPREHTWIDPETGLTCRDILGGFGSACSNF
jgi:hypothetical protein